MFSKTTYSYGLFIVVSASFMLQLLEFFYKIFGTYNIQLTLYLLSIFAGLILIIYAVKKGYTITQLSMILIILCLGLLLMYSLPIFGEKTHVILYGTLGYLAIKDTYNKISGLVKSLSYAILFTSAINLLDELFQAILPYRVGEVRDILVNFICTILGFLLYFALKKKNLS